MFLNAPDRSIPVHWSLTEPFRQVLNLVQSYVTLRVPLYVSYVFHSPVGTGGWQHFDLQSELRLTFVYDTAILWKDGIGSPPQAELQGTSQSSEAPVCGLNVYRKVAVVWLCVRVFVFARCAVSYQHANQRAGTSGGELPHQGSFQGSVCGVALRRQNQKSWWGWQMIINTSLLLKFNLNSNLCPQIVESLDSVGAIHARKGSIVSKEFLGVSIVYVAAVTTELQNYVDFVCFMNF